MKDDSSLREIARRVITMKNEGGGKRRSIFQWTIGATITGAFLWLCLHPSSLSLGSDLSRTRVILHPFLQSLVLTLRLALATTLVLLALGIPLAHWLNNSAWRGVPVVQTLVALPIVLPPTVIGFYLLVCFAPTHFPGSWWLRLTGSTLTFSFAGLLIGSVFYSLPYAVQPFQTALRGVPSSLLEAAAATGASPARTFWRVHLPLARSGLLLGATLSFAHTIGEFGVVLMLGGSIPGQTRVASIALYDEVEKFNYPTAHLYALTLLLISGALLSVVTVIQRRAPQTM